MRWHHLLWLCQQFLAGSISSVGRLAFIRKRFKTGRQKGTYIFHYISVTGLSIDYMVASVIGFFCYAVFALGMYVIPGIRAEYRRRHDNNDNLVALNDVIFAVDAFFITSVMLIQIAIYRVSTCVHLSLETK